jgi:hypothetical protein
MKMTTDYNCSPNQEYGGRGVTFWGPTSFTLTSRETPGSTVTLTFTPTKPECYQSFRNDILQPENVNVIWTIHTSDDAAQDTPEVGPIEFYLNGTHQGSRYHSRKAEHDLTEVYELANAKDTLGQFVYDESTMNTIQFVNTDTIAVTFTDFRIARVYQMCGMDKEARGCCIGSEPDPPPVPPCNDGNYPPCENSVPVGSSGNLDSSRADYPCNIDAFTTNAYRLSYTALPVADSVKMIPPNSTVSWTFTLPSDSALQNYHGPKAFFFNLNNLQLHTPATGVDDIGFGLSVNNSYTIPYYVTKVKEAPEGNFHSSAPGADLVASFGTFYHDGPYQSNTVRLNNNSGFTLLLCDAGDVDTGDCDECYDNPNCQGDLGKVNLYRIYETCTSCQNMCEISCQTGCEITCVTCITCNVCYVSCQDACQLSCQNCQTACELACQDCQTACELACQDCQTACELSCQDCQTGCEVSCQTACEVSCQVCYWCLACYSCYIACQEACQIVCQDCQSPCYASCQDCQTGCEVTCQTGCEVACQDCQTGCEVSCQYGCEVSCQGCQPPCFICYSWYT